MSREENPREVARLFPWFGAKARIATKLPAPSRDVIVEPFCGSTCYSLRYGRDRNVLLRDVDERLVSMWTWLINVSEDEFLSLPVYGEYSHVDEVEAEYGPDAAYYVRMWNHSSGSTTNYYPAPSVLTLAARSPGSYWDEAGKHRLPSALPWIRHWRVELGPYDKARNRNATWFVDPPYEKTYKGYANNNVDYEHLAEWVDARKGEVIVTERSPAKWLPFQKLGAVTAQGHASDNKHLKTKQHDLVYWRIDQ